MEKGLKTLQATARTAQRKAAANSNGSFEDGGIPDQNSDSGIGLGSEAEMEVDESASSQVKSSTWSTHPDRQSSAQLDHKRTHSLPQPLPLYRPPPPIDTSQRTRFYAPMLASPDSMIFARPPSAQRCSPDSQNGRGGISIQSVLS